MEWCCAVFQGWFQTAGTRGLGVFVSGSSSPAPSFILQFRALDPGKAAPHTEYPLSSVLDVHIQFCPWCGANLKKFYRNTYSSLEKPGLRLVVR